MARPKDEFANIAEISVTDSLGAGVPVYGELQTGISLGQGMGIIVEALEYRVATDVLQAMDNDGDYFIMAWSVSDNPSSIGGAGQKQIMDRFLYERTDSGTAGNSHFHTLPWKHDFLPPIIVAAPRLYAACQSNLGASALVYYFRMYFRYIELSTQEYLELAETFLLVG